MLPQHTTISHGIKAHDVLIFGELLTCEVLSILGMPASIGFWFYEPAYSPLSGLSPEQQEILATPRKDSEFVLAETMLVLSMDGPGGQSELDVVIHNIDSALLQKMDAEWIGELQKTIQKRFEQFRRAYTDPLTGCYNQRALDLLLSGSRCWKSLYLIATVARTRSISSGFQKVAQLASLLDVTVRDPLFYFGKGVFGHVSLHCDRDVALQFSHRLISLLKREKLRRVHVGFSCMEIQHDPERTLSNCWEALLTAERRGPFSLCDAASLHGFKEHPLVLPEKKTLRHLQRAWRNLQQFGLVLLEQQTSPGYDPASVSNLLPPDTLRVELSPGTDCFVLPEYSAVQTVDTVTATADLLTKTSEDHPAIGYCHWPSCGKYKIDSLKNCRRALLHGSFYGSGAVVAFDALSLNISGDFYFDEGDYKQAIRDYQTGLQLQPDDVNLLNSLGVALAEVNRHRQAITCFEKVLAAKPGNFMSLVNKGMSCRQIGLIEEAMQCFESALQSKECPEKGNQELFFQLARLYCQGERFDQAVRLLEQWLENNGEPDEFLFFRLLGEAYDGSGRRQDAIKVLQKSLQLYPCSAESLSMLGYLYVMEGEGLEVGLSLCDKALAMDDTDPLFYYRKAMALYHAKQYKDALSVVRDALQKKRSFGPAVLLRGQIYEQLGLLKRAVQSYERLLSIKHVQAGHRQKARQRLDDLQLRN